MSIYLYFKEKCHWIKTKNKWKRKENHNFTRIIEGSTGIDNIIIGHETYGDIYCLNDSDKKKLHIGSFCSIGPEVTFIVGRDHELNRISSYPFKQRLNLCSSNYRDAFSKGNIIVDDDVWIGYRATILSGVHIGQGAVVAAGAVVTKDVPPYAIVGGVPAKVIKYRFSKSVIDVLLTIDYSKLNKDMVSEHIEDLYKSIDKMSVEEVKQAISWMPKK